MDWNQNRFYLIFRFKMSPSLRGSGLKLTSRDVQCIFWRRLPLYEGVDWNWRPETSSVSSDVSPSLRGSGLKYNYKISYHLNLCLPLYEGVDWNRRLQTAGFPWHPVSLFTREWIEIPINPTLVFAFVSPSLRGSGLKCKWSASPAETRRLPLYEGVDWNVYTIPS